MSRLLITGAAGRVGAVLRRGLRDRWDHVRLSDQHPLEPETASEECVVADLTDDAAVHELCRDVDAVIHLGGIPGEAAFDDILSTNVCGTHHVFEAARRQGATRVVFASSNHVTGFHGRSDRIDVDTPAEPDGFYGLSKLYGEGLGKLYHRTFGLEVVSIRIGSFVPEPRDRRMLSTWLSHRDGVELFHRALVAPDVGYLTIWGASANSRSWWDNATPAALLGYHPRDTADDFTERIEQATPQPDPIAPAERYQGGPFVDWDDALVHPDRDHGA